MTDAGWGALAQIVGSVCGLLAAVFAGKAWQQGKKNEATILQHEEASAVRTANLTAAAQPAVCRPVIGD